MITKETTAMRFFITILLACLLSFHLAAEPLQLQINNQPYTRHELRLDSDDIAQYERLAAAIGLDYDRIYSYTEFADAKRANNIESAGQYDFLLLSTGGNSWNTEDDMRAIRAPTHWEMTYLKNYDMTVIWIIENEGVQSFVHITKLARGRIDDLHLR